MPTEPPKADSSNNPLLYDKTNHFCRQDLGRYFTGGNWNGMEDLGFSLGGSFGPVSLGGSWGLDQDLQGIWENYEGWSPEQQLEGVPEDMQIGAAIAGGLASGVAGGVTNWALKKWGRQA